MRDFIKETARQLLGMVAVFVFLAGLICIAIGIFDNDYRILIRAVFIIAGVFSSIGSIAFLLWSKPKEAEGNLLYAILELMNLR
jgi:ABC-type proline/glycine betaine transport system permease subunit